MADNYLENKMDDYRSGRLSAGSRRKVTPSGGIVGRLTIDYPPKRVYVTGGANGIGRSIVKAFCDAGCRVAFCDIDQKAGTVTAQKCGAQFHPLDVTDSAALERSMQMVIERWGDIDVVINNVGIGEFKPFIDSTIDDFRHVLDTNLMPVWVTSHVLACHRRQAGWYKRASIINICSTRYSMSESGTEGYSASKGAIASLTHALMMSLSKLGVNVNCISPGWIDTTDGQGLRPVDHEFHPSGRVGVPADIARLCLFLASSDSVFINGENITVDGGVTHKMIYPE